MSQARLGEWLDQGGKDVEPMLDMDPTEVLRGCGLLTTGDTPLLFPDTADAPESTVYVKISATLLGQIVKGLESRSPNTSP